MLSGSDAAGLIGVPGHLHFYQFSDAPGDADLGTTF